MALISTPLSKHFARATITIDPKGDQDGVAIEVPVCEVLLKSDTDLYSYYRNNEIILTPLTDVDGALYSMRSIPGRRTKVRTALEGKTKKSVDADELINELLEAL